MQDLNTLKSDTVLTATLTGTKLDTAGTNEGYEMNHWTITGNLGKDPVLKFTNLNKAVTSFSLAVGQRVKQDGEWVDSVTMWVQVTFFGEQAERVVERYVKGDTVTVAGRLTYEEYEKDGVEKNLLKLIASEIEKVERPKKSEAVAASSDFIQAESAPF